MSKIYIPRLNLQLFAEAGNLVNATGNFVNAYTGTTTAFDSAHTLAPAIKTFYDTELLENARIDIKYGQFAETQPLPAGNGHTVEWRKWNTFDRATQLQEGVIPTGQKFGMTSITDTVNQYGTYTTISDRLELESYDPVILGATEEMGASAAETQEYLIREALLTNGNVLYCDNITLATGAIVSTPTIPAEMEATATTMSKLTPLMVAKAATKLKKDKVPTINGSYVAIIHPSVAHDLRQCPEWVEAHKYAAVKEIFNGEIGELHGVRFIEDNFAPVLKRTGYTNKAGGATYATYFLGKKPYGTIQFEGGGLQMIVKDKGQVGGPLEQFSTVGYKMMTNGAKVLYPERCLRVMSCSSYSAVDAEN